ncbi:hypothetical protein JOF36_007492 [Pseudonocardia parietis]|uniref:Uncharacterized protein n=1 Tax=Pseudonocardia parietis TaxID=570936 RepID=A0ABS4W687_9PSEU|nr:hypothetical protein [Pseudonocardia parietis]
MRRGAGARTGVGPESGRGCKRRLHPHRQALHSRPRVHLPSGSGRPPGRRGGRVTVGALAAAFPGWTAPSTDSCRAQGCDRTLRQGTGSTRPADSAATPRAVARIAALLQILSDPSQPTTLACHCVHKRRLRFGAPHPVGEAVAGTRGSCSSPTGRGGAWGFGLGHWLSAGAIWLPAPRPVPAIPIGIPRCVHRRRWPGARWCPSGVLVPAPPESSPAPTGTASDLDSAGVGLGVNGVYDRYRASVLGRWVDDARNLWNRPFRPRVI